MVHILLSLSNEGTFSSSSEALLGNLICILIYPADSIPQPHTIIAKGLIVIYTSKVINNIIFDGHILWS